MSGEVVAVDGLDHSNEPIGVWPGASTMCVCLLPLATHVSGPRCRVGAACLMLGVAPLAALPRRVSGAPSHQAFGRITLGSWGLHASVADWGLLT